MSHYKDPYSTTSTILRSPWPGLIVQKNGVGDDRLPSAYTCFSTLPSWLSGWCGVIGWSVGDAFTFSYRNVDADFGPSSYDHGSVENHLLHERKTSHIGDTPIFHGTMITRGTVGILLLLYQNKKCKDKNARKARNSSAKAMKIDEVNEMNELHESWRFPLNGNDGNKAILTQFFPTICFYTLYLGKSPCETSSVGKNVFTCSNHPRCKSKRCFT